MSYINVCFYLSNEGITNVQGTRDMMIAELVLKFLHKSGKDINNLIFYFNSLKLEVNSCKTLDELGIGNCTKIDVVERNRINAEIDSNKIIDIVLEDKNKEIKKLRDELKESNVKIKQLNDIILEFKTQFTQKVSIYLNKIKELENNITLKNNQLKELKTKLQNINNINQKGKTVKYADKCVTFISSDQKIIFGIPCSGTSTFAEVEELLYREYPEYRETNNVFLANGKVILRFKTINDNNVGTGRPVMLTIPS
jgi:hypothetical protein